MKINQWTLGLAAVGLVSFASVTQAEEAASENLLTALSSTVISGYVDVGAHWAPGKSGDGYYGMSPSVYKRDGFDVNSVLIRIEKPLEEGEWSAGYTADVQFMPGYEGGEGGDEFSDSFGLRQAYVALRAPVGNGIDFKVGKWDTIIGYESNDGYKNPNYTRSYGYALTPTQHTGVLASYQAADFLALNAGVANTADTGAVNARSTRGESKKAYMGSIAITAPEDMGVLAGSALYAGVIKGFGSATDDFTDYYVGATIKTGIEGVSLGADFNFFDSIGGVDGDDAYTTAGYISFKATEKLGLHLRGEYVSADPVLGGVINHEEEIIAGTVTLQYDLWENVLSRLEVRWDHVLEGHEHLKDGTDDNDVLLAANLVYKF